MVRVSDRVLGTGACRAALAVVVLGIVLAGCSSSSIPGMSSVSRMFGSSNSASDASAAVPPPQQIDFDCPTVGIRMGAATLAISAGQNEEGALNMRYQVGIGDTARECTLANNIVTMKVGMQGRVVLGPAGGPGQIDVPLRFAVVQEGTEPKTIMTRLQHVKVSIPDSTPNVLFTHVEEGLSFPMPKGGDIDAYIVYIGFDPHAQKEIKRPERKPAPKPRRPAT